MKWKWNVENLFKFLHQVLLQEIFEEMWNGVFRWYSQKRKDIISTDQLQGCNVKTFIATVSRPSVTAVVMPHLAWGEYRVIFAEAPLCQTNDGLDKYTNIKGAFMKRVPLENLWTMSEIKIKAIVGQ